MTEEALRRGTGRTIAQWRSLIGEADLAEAPHKEIADFLHREYGVSSWWAQEVTVEYERLAGRRVPGQTQDGRFQIGVSRTVRAGSDRLWRIVASDAFVDALLADAPPSDIDPVDGNETNEARLAGLASRPVGAGVEAETTTFERGSHVRMRWRLPGWPEHSILQIRVTPKPGEKSTLSIHHERLPSGEAREQMRARWKALAAAVDAAVKGE